jgi:hypothetical protein
LTPSDHPPGRSSSIPAWSTTTDAPSDLNAALWASLRPPPPPPWHHSLRERVSELSLPLIAERIGSQVPPWVTSRWAARHWLASVVLGLTLGLGLGHAVRPLLRDASDEQGAALAAASVSARAAAAPALAPEAPPSPAAVGSVSADDAPSATRLTAEPAAVQLDEATADEPHVARARPKSRAARVAALKKKRAKATAQRGARSRRASQASTHPRTIAAYLKARARANRVAKNTSR